MSYKKPVLLAARICTKTRGDYGTGADNEDLTGFDKTQSFIVAVSLDEQVGPWNATFTLRWRNVTDSGSFAALASTGECKWATDTDLVNETVLETGTKYPTGDRLCNTTADVWYAGGREIEGAATSVATNIPDERYTEFHYAVSLADAHDGDTYEFEIYENTGPSSIGTLACSIATSTPRNINLTGASAESLVLTDQTPSLQVGALSHTVFDAIAFGEADPTIFIPAGPRLIELTGANAEVLSFGETINSQLGDLYRPGMMEDIAFNDDHLIDFYGYTHYSVPLQMQAASYTIAAQSFHGTGLRLTSAKFYLYRYGSPSGNIKVRVYLEKHTTAFGVDSYPDEGGGIISESDSISIGTLSDSGFALTEFIFRDPVVLANGTAYCIALLYSGGDASNCLYVGADNAFAEHEGNASWYSSSWGTDAGSEFIFYLLTDAELQLSDLSNIVQSTIAFEDSPTPVITGDLYNTVFDALAFGETITRQNGDLNKSISDDLSFYEDVIDYFDRPYTIFAMSTGATTGLSQSFTGNGEELHSVIMKLSKAGSPAGNATCRLYLETHLTAFGTDSVPTGSILAESDSIDVSTLDAYPIKSKVTFHFSSPYTLTNGTKYCVVIAYSGTSSIYVWADNITASHPGNYAYWAVMDPWLPSSTVDMVFVAISTYAKDKVLIGDLAGSVYDAIAFEDVPTSQLTGDLYSSVFDALVFTEAEVIYDMGGDKFVTVSETLTFTEAELAPVIGDVKRTAISETVHFHEGTLTMLLEGDLNISLSDNIAATEHDWFPEPGWTYRKSVTASRADGSVTDYQMILKVGESSGSSGYDVHCESHCKSDFSDLRFTRDDGKTLQPYWIEEITGTTPNQTATVWIKCGFIDTTNTTFFMYYGNADASAVSNGDDTFIGFNDFEWGIVGENVHLKHNCWVSGGTAVIGDGQAFNGTKSLQLNSSCTVSIGMGPGGWLTTDDPNRCVRFRYYPKSVTSMDITHGSATEAYGINVAASTPHIYYFTSGGAYTDTGVDAILNEWNLFEICNINFVANTMDLWHNGVKILDGATAGFATSFWGLGPNFRGGNTANPPFVDCVMLRNWRDVEPVWGSWSAEESTITSSVVAEVEGDLSTSIYDEIIFAESTNIQILFEGEVSISVSDNLVFSETTDQYTKLLLHFNGADGSQAMVDSSPSHHGFRIVGGAQLDTAQKKFGESSLMVDGDDWIVTPYSSDFDFGADNFTIDFWIKWNVKAAASQVIYSQWDGADDWIQIWWTGTSTQQLKFAAVVAGVTQAQYYCAWNPGTSWYHVAVVRNGTSMLCFIDGVSQTFTAQTAIGSKNITLDTPCDLYIGSDTINDVSGWLDELRISKGIARWTAGFTVPAYEYPSDTPYLELTGDLSVSLYDAINMSGAEGFDSYVVALLHMNGTDGSQVFTDEISRHTWVANQTAQIDTDQKQFGTASALFDGSYDYIYVGDWVDWDFGTAPFTIDCWVRFADHTITHEGIIEGWGNASNYWGLFVYTATHLHFQGVNAGAWICDLYCEWTPAVNTWYHIAVIREGAEIRFYVDGQQKTTIISNSPLHADHSFTLPVGTTIRIGSNYGGSQYFMQGWIDEFRISKGVARWSSNFTPPTSEYAQSEVIAQVTGDLIPTTSDALTFGETLTRQVGSVVLSVYDALAFEENVLYDVGGDRIITVVETLAFDDQPSGQVTGDLSTTLFDAVGFEDSPIVQVGDVLWTISDALAFGETLTPLLGQIILSVYDELTFGENVLYDVSGDRIVIVVESLAFDDQPSGQVTGALFTSVFDALAFQDSPTPAVGSLSRSVSDTLALTDTILSTQLGNIVISTSDELHLEDIAQISMDVFLTASDSLSFTESLTPSVIGNLSTSLSDNLTFGEYIGVALDLLVSISEDLGLTDAPTLRVVGALLSSLSDSLHLAEQITPQVGAVVRSLSESMTVTDGAVTPTISNLLGTIWDTLHFEETAWIGMDLLLHLSEDLSLVDLPAFLIGGIQQTISDLLNFSDSITAVEILNPPDLYAVVYDLLGFTESTTSLVTGNLSEVQTESLTFVENVTVQIVTEGKDPSLFAYAWKTPVKPAKKPGRFEYERF